ncbi:MAG: hypothetical protein JXM71_10590 [Spirochaetales bacterium]|nr:hypothetical protein [Spirochaetales bacterium]
MTCKRFLILLDGLDNGELPPEMIAHARSCPACAHELDVLRSAMNLYRVPCSADSADIAPLVAARVREAPTPRRAVSMRDWLVSGLVIVASMVLIPLLAAFRQLRADYGSGFTVSVSLVFGLLLTVYASLFVMGHLEEFSRRLKEHDEVRQGRTA